MNVQKMNKKRICSTVWWMNESMKGWMNEWMNEWMNTL